MNFSIVNKLCEITYFLGARILSNKFVSLFEIAILKLKLPILNLDIFNHEKFLFSYSLLQLLKTVTL